MRRYSVHEIFGPTIQGEGGMTGTVCHFLRFSGCNMWDGRPATRAASRCPFCDTDFFSHTLMTADQIVERLAGLPRVEWVTISGGEPALQLDDELCDALHDAGYLIAVETNGTRELRGSPDYVTLSPKLPPARTIPAHVDCLKVLYPHPNPLITPEAFAGFFAGSRYIQPITTGDAATNALNLSGALALVYRLPEWKLSVQLHKLLGVA